MCRLSILHCELFAARIFFFILPNDDYYFFIYRFGTATVILCRSCARVKHVIHQRNISIMGKIIYFYRINLRLLISLTQTSPMVIYVIRPIFGLIRLSFFYLFQMEQAVKKKETNSVVTLKWRYEAILFEFFSLSCRRG